MTRGYTTWASFWIMMVALLLVDGVDASCRRKSVVRSSSHLLLKLRLDSSSTSSLEDHQQQQQHHDRLCRTVMRTRRRRQRRRLQQNARQRQQQLNDDSCALKKSSCLDRVLIVPHGGGSGGGGGSQYLDTTGVNFLAVGTLSFIMCYALYCFFFPLQQMAVWGFIQTSSSSLSLSSKAESNGNIVVDNNVDPVALSLWEETSLRILFVAFFPLLDVGALQGQFGHFGSFILYYICSVFGVHATMRLLKGGRPVYFDVPMSLSQAAGQSIWLLPYTVVGAHKSLASELLEHGEMMYQMQPFLTGILLSCWAVHALTTIPTLYRSGNRKAVRNLAIFIGGAVLVTLRCFPTEESRLKLSVVCVSYWLILRFGLPMVKFVEELIEKIL